MEPTANKSDPGGRSLALPISAHLNLRLACLSACLGVLASRWAGLPGAAIVTGLALCASLAAGRTTAWLFAIPAALGAIALPTPSSVPPKAGPVMLQGEVEGDMARDKTTMRSEFTVRCEGGLVRCTGPLSERILPGDSLRGMAFATGRSFRGIPTIRVEPRTLEIVGSRPTARRFAVALRFALEEQLLKAIPGPRGNLLCHLVLGSGPRLSEQVLTDHRATGLTHLLAVSGAHASMLAWLLGVIFVICSGRHPWSSRGYRRFCAIVLLVYGCITGWEPPVFRALVAYAALLMATGKARRLPISATLALPALLTALIVPDDLFSASFCLSYAAVFGLICAGVLKNDELWAHWLRAPLRASCWAVLTTAPISLYYFGQIAPWTILATPLLGPVVATMLALGLLTAILGLIAPALAELIASPLSGITGFYQFSVELLAELPWTPIFAPTRPTAIVLLAFVLIGLIALSLQPNRRGVIVLCVSASLPNFLPLSQDPTPGLSLLDVGHGQACLLHLQSGRTVLVDCGSLGGSSRAARAVDRHLERRHIDWLILSHSDADHTGSVGALLDRLTIGQAVLPDAMRRHPLARRLSHEGCEIHWLNPGDIHQPEPGINIRAPRLRHGSSNAKSLWVHARIGTLRMVLPGDAEASAIRDWLTTRAHAEVLILPHHGREDSPLAVELVRELGVLTALVSNGDTGKSSLVDRVRSMGIPVITSAQQGTIRVSVHPDKSWTVTSERQIHHRTPDAQSATVPFR